MQALSGILSNLFVTVVVVGVISAALANVINNQVRRLVLHVLACMLPPTCSDLAHAHGLLTLVCALLVMVMIVCARHDGQRKDTDKQPQRWCSR